MPEVVALHSSMQSCRAIRAYTLARHSFSFCMTCKFHTCRSRLASGTVRMLVDACLHMQAADGVKRAQRGGMLTGAMLTAVASLLTGATRLQRGIISAAASSQEGGQITENSPIWPIYAPIKVSNFIATQQRNVSRAQHTTVLWST